MLLAEVKHTMYDFVDSDCSKVTLRKKREPKQCPQGTVLENGSLFSEKGKVFQNIFHKKVENGALLKKAAPFLLKKKR